MFDKRDAFAIFLAFALCLSPLFGLQGLEKTEGYLSISFMGEQVGYEMFSWEEDPSGYRLEVRGRTTKPVALEIERMVIKVDRAFLPISYYFKGSVMGMEQEVTSSIVEGAVVNTITAGGHEQKNTVKVRRDSFLFPNPLFSPYLILTKKFRCLVEAPVECSAYIIPQLEVPFILESTAGDFCTLLLRMKNTEIEIETDADGDLKSLRIPSQHLAVITE